MTKKYIVAGYAVDSKLPGMTREDLLKLTHLNVAFGHVREDEICTDHMKHVDVLREIKRNHPDLNVMLSVGGWGAGGFSEAASTEEGRGRMAESAVRILTDYPFDGIDLDWEYPCYSAAGIQSSADDKTNFTLLLKTMREALDRKSGQDGRPYLLTIAAGADQYYVDGTEMDLVQQYVDFVQVMTYDMRGGFQTLTGHHTNLYTPSGDLFRISTDSSINMFIRAGVPKEKIVIGAAFYSRIWQQVPDINRGLHQMAGSTGGYGPDFTTLAADYIDKNGYTRFWDEEARAPFLFNGSSLISYEDEESIRHKCDYVKSNELAGMMFWEYSCDMTHRLLSAIYQGLEE
ncbi:glycoside hydrolase family 18 protein [Paenibacillus alkaliterrae]|uniref:glycoside hydrolase family 18 protein n=1 Tax=Paenibacillus alkaliterrae TaxID=320909 RepID=UPI001F27E43F|nr:glycoside hydrolase family 18 protein [Paenibacillus alkaliterrae]MCF2938099.1 glycoside hydrolase family 18 protein [Paenibacillus alkaliterrae]